MSELAWAIVIVGVYAVWVWQAKSEDHERIAKLERAVDELSKAKDLDQC